MKHLFIFGFGYTATALAKQLDHNMWRISATTRKAESLAGLKAQNVEGHLFSELKQLPQGVSHILSCITPTDAGDPVITQFAEMLQGKKQWLGYLSTTGVYGDHQGGLVDEASPVRPNSQRALNRVLAEQQWQKFNAHVFRLPGIYGPGRSQLDALRNGRAKMVIKPGQIFSRIHVNDLASALAASMARPNPGRIYNIADDEPCPPQDVIAFAAHLMGVAPPPPIAFEDANLSAMARSFYEDSKRVLNARMKSELGIALLYPSYREGLSAIFRETSTFP